MIKISTFYIKNEQINNENISIVGNDVKHIKNVLRYKVDDELEVCDENAVRYKTKIIKFLEEEIMLEILEISQKDTEMSIAVDLYQGLPKSDKMDMIVQKNTELGINKIVPVLTERVIVKIENSNEKKKIERWNKIAAEAAKQSGRQRVPHVENVVNLENIVENLSKYDIVIVPFECEKDKSLKMALKNIENKHQSIAIVIGPEGGFSDKDIAVLEKLSNVVKVSLGERILRTETAGIATLAMILYEYEL
ncbi:MAG: 16S rRNA (uracil(1498)-N(3))-methyltransferase [Clostridia bacterium]|nr:16S rRNA (uracil(1498)-N(3))-methyltransferase [Clostridia bacterium]